MSLSTMSNLAKQKSSLCPTNGRQTVGDGAATLDIEPSVLAVCQMQGTDDIGGFDIPKAKCPPDRGSSECVTGRPTPISSINASSPDSNYSLHNFTAYPQAKTPTYDSFPFHKPLISPRAIPARYNSDISTPPLTPDGGSDCSDRSDSPIVTHSQQKDALDFLMTLFPEQGLNALPYAKSISISAPTLGSSFEGMVLDLPGKSRTLYVDAKSAQSVSLRESIVALLDLADERLECSALVIVLERSSPMLGEILHSLMYVGGTVVTKPPFKADPTFVLVGMDV